MYSLRSAGVRKLSPKINSLNAEDLERYREKIELVGGHDPYLFEYETDTLPLTIDYDKILYYLVNQISFRTGNPMRNFKSLESYKSFENGFVKEVKGHKMIDIYAVKGSVLHSMSIMPAESWILINDAENSDVELGNILAAHCDCTAGAGETCSHVGAVLYALSYAREICLGKQVSVTELPAYWCQPSGSVQDNLYIPIESVDFGRKTETSCDLQFYDLEKSEEDYKRLICDLMETGQDVAAYKSFFECAETTDINETNDRKHIENILFDRFFEDENVNRTLEELIHRGQHMDWKISQEDCELIERLTQDQSSDPLWFKARFGRITASIFGKCVRTSITNPSRTLLQAIFSTNSKQQFAATLHGKLNEEKGVKSAINVFNHHSNFTHSKCGLIINPEYPYFAASPDHLFSCDCCGKVVVEIKCPFKFDHLSKEEGINVLLHRKSPYLIQVDDKTLALNPKHEYYFQVQMQIFVAGANYAFFVVWAPKFELFFGVKRNEIFWEENSKKAVIFFENVVAPELLGKYFSTQEPV